MIRDHILDYAAIGLWVIFALCASLFRHDVAPQQASLVGAGAVTTTFWALLRHRDRPRPGSDKIVVDAEDYKKLVAASALAARASMSEQNDGGGGCVKRPA